MNTGDMRLHWDAADGTHLYEDFPCLHDALERAGQVYAMAEGTLTRLENWMGEDACPPQQLLPVAQMRAAEQDRQPSRDRMEAHSLWGQF